MPAPFRYPIAGLTDLERLIDTLATSTELVPGSLRLAEGMEALREQLASEGRVAAPLPPRTPGEIRDLIRALWEQPLAAQHPRYLRLNARLAADPRVEVSMRIDVPTAGDWPRWVDLEGSRDPSEHALLRTAYASLGRDVGLRFLAV